MVLMQKSERKKRRRLRLALSLARARAKNEMGFFVRAPYCFLSKKSQA
jgi:hypothetical protein